MSRPRRSVVAGFAVLGLFWASPPATAQSLVETPTKSHQSRVFNVKCIPGATLICAADTIASGAVGAIGDAAGRGVDVAADAMLGGIVGWAADGAAWLVKSIAKQMDRSTRPALGSAWFAKRYGAMRQLAISLSVLFLLAAILQAAVRRDLAMLLRACLVALPLAMLLTFAAVTLVEAGLALTDGLTAAAVKGSGADTSESFADLAGLLSQTGTSPQQLPGLVLFLAAVLTAVLALVVWIELILREAAIYVAVAFLPICLAAMTWQQTSGWARRLAEWLMAIVLAKFTIAVAFAVAGSMLGQGRGGSGGLSALLGGCAVLLVAALSPWVLLRLIPFAEQAAGGLNRAAVKSARSSAPGAAATSLLVRQAMLKNFGAATGSAASRPAVAAQWTPPAAGRKHPEQVGS